MLTLKQINEISFRKSNFSGYKPEDVDAFIDEVSESFATLLKENQAYKAKAVELATKNTEMREKLVVLAEKIESYRNQEDGIKDALLSAQKLGNASVKDANKKAETIIATANRNADEILEEARKKSTVLVDSCQSKIEAKEKEFNILKENVTLFRSSLYDMYRNHVTAIEAIPDFTEEIAEAKKVKENNTYEAKFEDFQDIVVEEVVEESAPVAEPTPPVRPAPEMSATQKTPKQKPAPKKAEPSPIEEDMTFDDIDLNAFSSIPETLKKEKESLYSTLAFGDDVDIKK